MKQQLTQRITQAISEHIFPGCVVGVAQKSETRLVLPFGQFTYDQNSAAMAADSLFDVASVTKAIPTSSLALMLIDQGKLHLDDQLISFVPEFQNSDRERILIQHLLAQNLCYTFSLADHKDKAPDEILNSIFTSELKEPPGTSYAYTNATSILLGMVVERIMGDSLDRLAQMYFFEPLGMTRTTFRPLKKFAKQEIVPTEIDLWRGREIQGEVHDESAWVLNKKMVVGSAGLFSTAPDLLNFLEMLLKTNSLVSPFNKGGLRGIFGWEMNQQWMGSAAGSHTFGKTGFTGCSVLIEPERGVGIVLLSNTTYPHRRPLAEHRRIINEVRRDVADIVFQMDLFPTLLKGG